MSKNDSEFILGDCQGTPFSLGKPVYYLDDKGELCRGIVTRCRVEIDGKVLRSPNKVKRSYEDLQKIKEDIQNG